MGQNLTKLMRIELNNLTAGPESVQRNHRTVSPTASEVLPSFEESLQLNEALANTPEVRAEKMARARALVADPNYPSRAQIKQVARLLAANWENENPVATSSPRYSSEPSPTQ